MAKVNLTIDGEAREFSLDEVQEKLQAYLDDARKNLESIEEELKKMTEDKNYWYNAFCKERKEREEAAETMRLALNTCAKLFKPYTDK